MTEPIYPPTYLLVYRRVQSNDLSVCVCWRWVAARMGGSKGGKERFKSVRQREKEKWDSYTIGGGVIQEQTHQLEEPRLVTWPAGRPQQGVCISRKVARAGAFRSQNTWTIQVTINTRKRSRETPLLANLSFPCCTHMHSRRCFYGIIGVEIVPTLRNVLFIQVGRYLDKRFPCLHWCMCISIVLARRNKNTFIRRYHNFVLSAASHMTGFLNLMSMQMLLHGLPSTLRFSTMKLECLKLN